MGEINVQKNISCTMNPLESLIAQSALVKKETEILHASSLQRRGLNCSVKASLTKLHQPNVESSKDFNGLQHFLSQSSLYIYAPTYYSCKSFA